MAVLSGKRKEFLNTMLASWVREQLIEPEQAQKIRERHGLLSADTGGFDRVVKLFTLTGALLAGTGTLLMIASNWEEIPRVFRLILIFSGLIGLYGTGYYFQFIKKNYLRLGEALIFCGTLFFGGAIWLVAQIYQIESEYHLGMLVWGMGAFSVAVFTQSRFTLLASSVMLAFWNFWRCDAGQGPNFYYLAVLAALLWGSFKLFSKITVFSVLAGFLIWLGAGFLDSYSFSGPEAFLLFFLTGILFLLASQLHEALSRPFFSPVYRITGIAVLAFISYLSTFSFLDDLPSKEKAFFYLPIFIFLLAAQGSLLIFFKRQKKMIYEAGLTVLSLIFALIYLFSQSHLAVVIAGNLFVLTLSLSVMASGYLNHEKSLVNAGFVIFILHFFTRYLDWAWNYLPRAVFFLTAGIVLLAGGTLLEKKRRRLLARMKKESSHE